DAHAPAAPHLHEPHVNFLQRVRLADEGRPSVLVYLVRDCSLAALGSQKQNAPAGLLNAREHRARVTPTTFNDHQPSGNASGSRDRDVPIGGFFGGPGRSFGPTLNRSESRCWVCPHELSRPIALDELRIVLAQRPAKTPNAELCSG